MKKLLLLIPAVLLLSAQTQAQYNVIWNFASPYSAPPWDSNGNSPVGSLTISGKVMYGMTQNGGLNGTGNSINAAGNIFSINTDGTNYTDLHDFSYSSPSGNQPRGNVTLSKSGKVLYGMTWIGGANNGGMIFSMNTNGTGYKDIYDFQTTSGAPYNPLYGSLTLIGGKLYGMTEYGGSCNSGNGTIFSIDTNGNNFTDLHDFCGNPTDGSAPMASLTLSGSHFFGMTNAGGTNNDGVIFSMDTSGLPYKVVYNFDAASGTHPFGDITVSGTTLYGMTQIGGANNTGTVFSLDSNGTGFKVLWNFDDTGSNGYGAYGDILVEGNTLYGMTEEGGMQFGNGCLFSLNAGGGGYINLVPFNGNNGGLSPFGNLTPVGNMLYGMTCSGGNPAFPYNSAGVIFSYEVPGLGINTVSDKNNLLVYPNPAKDIVNISFTNSAIANHIYLYSITGQQIMETTRLGGEGNQTLQISTSNLVGGTYLLKVIAEDGNSYMDKVVVIK